MKKPTKPAAKPKRMSAAKPVQKPDVVHQEHVEPAAEPNCKFPDQVDFEPLADFRLIAWDSDEKAVEILLTSYEYIILKDHLAKLRGYVVPAEDAGPPNVILPE
jgi:hypothetical protein